MPRFARFGVVAAFLAAIGVRVAAVASPDALARLVDDSFICFDVARTLGMTGRLSTSGVQPLYVLLCAPIYAVLRPESAAELDAAARASVAVGAVADLVAMALLVWVLYRAGGSVAAVVGAWLWAVHPGAVAFAANGLETSVALAAMLGVVLVAEGRRDLLTGALVGLAMMARVDLAGIGVAVALCAMWDGRKGSVGALVRRAGALAAGWALVYVPWVAFLYWQTGDVLPVSGPATLLMGYTQRVIWNVERPGESYSYWLLTLAVQGLGYGAPVVAVLAAMAAPFTRRIPRVLALHCAFVAVFYVGVHGLFHYVGRYLAPWLVLEVVAVALGVAALARVRPAWRLAPIAVGAVALAVGLTYVPLRAPNEVRLDAGGAVCWMNDYRAAALEWRDRVPAGATVAAPESGALAYYLTNPVVNADGVCNREAYRAIRRQRLGEYLIARGCTLVVGRRADAILTDSGPSVRVTAAADGARFKLWEIRAVEVARR